MGMRNSLVLMALLAPLLVQRASHAQTPCRDIYERMERLSLEMNNARSKANAFIASRSATNGQVCPVAIKSVRIFDAYNATYKAHMECVCKRLTCDQGIDDEYKSNLKVAADNRKELNRTCKGYWGKEVERSSWE